MAKTDTETVPADSEAPKFQIQRHRADDKPGKYDAEVQALINADNELTDDDIAEGIYNSLPLIFPKEKDGKDVVAKYKRYVQDSAKRYKRTAREVDLKDNGDGTVTFEFRLVDQVTRPRKPRTETPADTATEAEAPQEAAAA